MSNENVVIESDEDRLEYTQTKRKQLVEFLTPGNSMPADKGDKMILLSALDGMDKASLTKLRIKADEKQTDASSQAAGIFAKLLKIIVPEQAKNFDNTSILPTQDVQLPAIELIEGEMDVGTQNGNFETFSKQYVQE